MTEPEKRPRRRRLRWVLLLVAVSALLSPSCCRLHEHAPMNADPATPLAERLTGPLVAAHQGGLYLDANTLHRFEQARLAGGDIVEMDLRETADGVAVVHHDETVSRLFGEGPRVDSLTAAELRAEYTRFGHPIPTFEEVLAWARGRVVVNAEFKTQEVIPAAVALVRAYDAYNWVYFQTKADRERYAIARGLDAAVPLLFKPMSMEDLDWALSLDDPHLVVIEIDPTMRLPEVIARARDAGKLTSYNAWRFAPVQAFFRALVPEVYDRGMDIAVTNRPRSAVRQRDAWAAAHGRTAPAVQAPSAASSRTSR